MRLLGRVQTKLSFAVPNGGQGKEKGKRKGKGKRKEKGKARRAGLAAPAAVRRPGRGSEPRGGDAAGRGCQLFPQMRLLLPVESGPFLLGPPWYFSG